MWDLGFLKSDEEIKSKLKIAKLPNVGNNETTLWPLTKKSYFLQNLEKNVSPYFLAERQS